MCVLNGKKRGKVQGKQNRQEKEPRFSTWRERSLIKFTATEDCLEAKGTKQVKFQTE